jgi:hypothetical protein
MILAFDGRAAPLSLSDSATKDPGASPRGHPKVEQGSLG